LRSKRLVGTLPVMLENGQGALLLETLDDDVGDVDGDNVSRPRASPVGVRGWASWSGRQGFMAAGSYTRPIQLPPRAHRPLMLAVTKGRSAVLAYQSSA
jgi:hypothetical protein